VRNRCPRRTELTGWHLSLVVCTPACSDVVVSCNGLSLAPASRLSCLHLLEAIDAVRSALPSSLSHVCMLPPHVVVFAPTSYPLSHFRLHRCSAPMYTHSLTNTHSHIEPRWPTHMLVIMACRHEISLFPASGEGSECDAVPCRALLCALMVCGMPTLTDAHTSLVRVSLAGG
jgi:hypothetical protein